MTSKAVIIVAGGKGLRMGGEVPKQFLPIAGKPILMHTIECFLQYDKGMQVVLVLPVNQQEYWQTLCTQHNFSAPHTVANGGETRFHSVKNGLDKVSSQVAFIGVHDGVRPFASIETISACYDTAKTAKAIVPVIDVVETVRRIINSSDTETVPRSDYKLVQTPQVFDAALLRKAYTQPYTDFFTDDASVVECFGHPVTLVQGNRENIKITTPFDIVVANAIMQMRQ
ncbi:MAG: 2-C-methyl-D-erythritol 4-phosphate cytidylyltransferase [Prevotellaceae bacterium]|nr:2-C-methyl-D-erythritol 4-phosphate cytidylyltransferase [Prevotellaceae bacterium]